jgi:hypothetical protein
MDILMPDEVERRNIITKKEIAAAILALRYALNPSGVEVARAAVQRNRKLVESAMAKFERVLAEMKS